MEVAHVEFSNQSVALNKVINFDKDLIYCPKQRKQMLGTSTIPKGKKILYLHFLTFTQNQKVQNVFT